MRKGNSIYTNNFQGFTTIILEIEDNVYSNHIEKIRKYLESLGTMVYENSLNIINKYDEDMAYGWKFVVVSDQNETCIQSVINDIIEILS